MDRRADPAIVAGIGAIVLLGSGSSWNATLMAKYFFEAHAGISVAVEHASEFCHRCVAVDCRTLCIVVSDSGECTDTVEALRAACQRGAPTLAGGEHGRFDGGA